VAINAWFQLVQRTRLQYGISDDDIYNFDETGFTMGLIATVKVVTSSDTIGRATTIQPGNREWVTAIEGINATGWAIPPFIILAGRVHQSNWYKGLSPDWVIALSDNGWTNDQLGLEWVKHFNTHTEARTKGTNRLLILDGHGSHATPEFDRYCKANHIVTLCMPAHTSHLLQPLDVSCFSPLKRFYGLKVQDLVRCGIQHIDKDDFLEIYCKIRPIALTKDNIRSGFQATGLIPYAPERVLSSLTVTKPPTPPGTADGEIMQWTSETPHNLVELEQQARLVRELLHRQSQSPSSEAINRLIKGCQMAMHSAVILTKENTQLRLVNERRQRKQQHRRRYLANGGVLQAQQGQFLLDKVENRSQEASNNDQVGIRKRAPQTCSNCHIQGHNRLSCPTS
jgi:DDE superfamily endonuclease